MRTHRTLTTIAAVAALVALTGCGSDDTDTPAVGSDPTSAATDAGGDETDSPSGGLVDICTKITVAEVAAIVGAPVTVEEVPGGGCTFEQEDPRAVSVAISSTAFDEGNGGFDGAVSGVSGTLEGDGEEVPGIGDEAFVKTGTLMGGESIKGGGVVHVGGTLVQVTLLQAEELKAPKVKSLVVDILKLAASKG